jgi:hypothetical protein
MEKGESEFLRLFKYQRADIASGHYLNYFINNHKKKEKEGELEMIMSQLSKIGWDKLYRMYTHMEKKLEENVKIENYEFCAEVKLAMDYFKDYSLGAAPKPKNGKTLSNI